LAPAVGILGVGIMSLVVLSTPPRSNSTIDGSQIYFGTIGFRPHPPTLISIFAKFDQETDLMIRSLNFCVGSQGSFRLSDPIYSSLLIVKSAAATMLASSVGSSSEVNSLVSISDKPTKSEGDLANYLTKSRTT
jgi:hypothetical protein